MNSTGVVHRRGFAILVLLAAVALAVYLVHARLGDDDRKTSGAGKPDTAAPAQPADPSASNGPAYGADAANGGDGYGAAPGDTEPGAAAAPVGFTTTSLTGKTVDRMGNVIVDSAGWTVYRYDRDSADPPTSNCIDQCAVDWPPILVEGDPQVAGIDPAKVGKITRSDGGVQLTVNGWPAYRYAGDGGAGKWKGQAVKNIWWVMQPTGARNLSCLPPGAVPPAA
jgi:predicted lipoprotein with Yx(FWY)xxD motif